jgi:hypothetical protein
MPRIYEAIKKECMRKGGSEKSCKTKAAKIYNSMRSRKKGLPKLSNKHKAR